MARLVVLLALSVACSSGQAARSAPPQKAAGAVAAPALAASGSPAVTELVFTGMCDASAAVPLDDHRFVVADDEDNVLRAYDVERPGAPLWSVDVSLGIGVRSKPPKPGKPEKPAPEADIEAATRVGDLAFWMTSHGRNSAAKLKPERLKLFATSLPNADAKLEVVGSAYEHLLEDLLTHPALAAFELRAAAELAPKTAGGLNLEGMTARLEGGVWIGFRNPIPQGKAIVLPLLNPEQLIRGQRAAFGAPQLLDLGGWGVRALSLHRGRYLILAGPFDGTRGARLYAWDGTGTPKLLAEQQLQGLSPEGFFSSPARSEVLVLSDDGSLLIGDVECKKSKQPAQKRFRARWLTL